MISAAHRAVLLLLLAAAASTVHAADAQRNHPVNQLSGDFSAVRTFSDYYAHDRSPVRRRYRPDTTRACVRMTNVEHCDIVGLLSAIVYDTKVSCCDKDEHGRDPSFLPVDNSIGKCSWRYDPYLLALINYLIDYNAGEPRTTEKVGTFSVHCDFHADAAECSEGLCDELSLEATGPVYLVPNAAVQGQPVLHNDIQCFLDTLSAGDLSNLPFPRTDGKSTRRGLSPADFAYLLPMNPNTNITELVATRKPSAQVKNINAKVAYDRDNAQADPTPFYTGVAIVAQGHVVVYNRHTKAKYDDGYLQTTMRYYLDKVNTGPITPSDGQFIADPYRVDLVLNKKEEGYQKY